MKIFYLLSLTLCFSFYLYSQTAKEFLIIPCKDGVLFIDGVSKGFIEANDVNRQAISTGEHYLQLKTNSDKINLTLTINDSTKNIIKIGCEMITAGQAQRLIKKQVSLSGALSSDTEQNIFGLDKDDEIIINCSILNKKGTATIFISDIEKGNEIYRKQDFKILENETIKIPTRGIYKIALYTDALFGKEANLTIDRIPSKNSSSKFNTSPKIVYDTVFSDVLKTVSRVYSMGNLDHLNKTILSINLPANTTYWTYWIGVDQEAQDGMKNFIEDLAPFASMFSANPLVLYGMKLIPSLPMMNTTATVNYKFMDLQNAKACANGLAYSYYKFKNANNVSTDYSIVQGNYSDIVLVMENQSALTGHNVEIRVVAFIVKPKFKLDE